MRAVPIDQAAADLGISRDTIYRLIRRHHLDIYRRTGDRRSYVDEDALRPFVELHPRRGPEVSK